MSASENTGRSNRPLIAFVFAIPIAILGGLIGLGGAEFRLPGLVAILGRWLRVSCLAWRLGWSAAYWVSPGVNSSSQCLSLRLAQMSRSLEQEACLSACLPSLLVARRGAFAECQALRETVAPMGVGSVIGAVIGGLLMGIISASLLKLGLGAILIFSAVRMFRHAQH